MSSEQRKNNDRRPAFVPGTVVVENPSFTGYCTIRDLSAGGAKLGFGTVPNLPMTFELRIPSQGKAYQVEVRWKRGLQLGVQFLSTRNHVG